jgi:hypothetical protein
MLRRWSRWSRRRHSNGHVEYAWNENDELDLGMRQSC